MFCVSLEGNGKVSMSINYIFTPASNAKGRHRCQYCRIHLESATSQSTKRQLLHYLTLQYIINYIFTSKNAIHSDTLQLKECKGFKKMPPLNLPIDNYSITLQHIYSTRRTSSYFHQCNLFIKGGAYHLLPIDNNI